MRIVSCFGEEVVRRISLPRFLWLFALLAVAVPGQGAIITLGIFSYDELIPASATPGVNAFSIANLTGAFALAPEYPVITDLSFLNSSVELEDTTGSSTLSLGDLSSGYNSPATLQFPSTQVFRRATFRGTLSPTLLSADGSMWLASSADLVSVLGDGAPDLTPGVYQLIQVEAELAPIPEPGAVWLVFPVLIGLAGLRSRKG